MTWDILQLLDETICDETEQNIVIYQWRTDNYLPMPKAEANN